MGKAVVSTTLGAEGLYVVPESRPARRGRPEGLASADRTTARRSVDLRARIGASARELVAPSYSWGARSRPSRLLPRAPGGAARRPDDDRESPPDQKPRGRGPHMPVLDGVRGVAILMVLCVHFIGDSPAYTAFERVTGEASQLRYLGGGPLLRAVRFPDHRAALRFEGIDPLFPQFLYAPHASHLPSLLRRTGRAVHPPAAASDVLIQPGSASPPTIRGGCGSTRATSTWPSTRAWALPYVGHFWSLAVEEQFYLVWPVGRPVLRPALAPRHLRRRDGSRARSSNRPVVRGRRHVALVVLTPCRFDALCIGGFVALAIRSVGSNASPGMASRCVGPLPALVLLASVWNARGERSSTVVLPIRGHPGRPHLRGGAGDQSRGQPEDADRCSGTASCASWAPAATVSTSFTASSRTEWASIGASSTRSRRGSGPAPPGHRSGRRDRALDRRRDRQLRALREALPATQEPAGPAGRGSSAAPATGRIVRPCRRLTRRQPPAPASSDRSSRR